MLDDRNRMKQRTMPNRRPRTIAMMPVAPSGDEERFKVPFADIWDPEGSTLTVEVGRLGTVTRRVTMITAVGLEGAIRLIETSWCVADTIAGVVRPSEPKLRDCLKTGEFEALSRL